MSLIPLLILIFGMVNVIRMTLFLIGSDIYWLKQQKSRKQRLGALPKVSIIIPAYNESATILATIASVRATDYPLSKREIIVVSDGSTDRTDQIVHEYIIANHAFDVRLVSQKNSGKANALNNGMKNYATGEYVMCLDADSLLHPQALKNAVKYFEDQSVVALSANVKIAPRKGLLNFIQQYEYLLCYQMKRAQTSYNIEYIIGGIGSMFRKSHLEKIGYYDGDTITEDIDLTMKILRAGNKNVRVIYGSDVITYTQSALSLSDLIAQRYRWKWGRYQTFLKNRSMFFSSDKRFTKGFSWIYLPYALFSDIAFLLEPLTLLYLLAVIVKYQDMVTMVSSLTIMTFYLGMSIIAEDTLPLRKRMTYLLWSPVMYFLFFVLSYVEYMALIKSLVKMHTLKASLAKNTAHWKPISRLGFSGQALSLR